MAVGITPAQAGKSANLVVHGVLVQDHPRTGGEKGLGSQVTQLSQGSPPRWRGKAIGMHYCAGVHRITPALAGKSRSGNGLPSCPTDHPRVGGEKTRTQMYRA